ncbi:MAG: GPR endopeptidase [Oscillospiraceae bacterium]|nr:GPR endopeptidase [Oscillospiraceae bacterium]
MEIRTDLALEAKEIFFSKSDSKSISGVISKEINIKGFDITTVEISDEKGAKAIGKPIGKYVTFEIEPFLTRDKNSFEEACFILRDILESILNKKDGSVLVAGLGNSAITADALGPFAVKNTMVTRHLVERVPEHFGSMRPVAAIAPGVLATTGLETDEIIKAVAADKDISAIVVIDALASRSLDRLCRTIQISDTGIIPGSGVGNHRNAINRETMGVPVVSIGVPTVVYAGTLAHDIAAEAGFKNTDLSKYGGDLIVTPRDIDENIRDMAKVIGYGINLSLHDITVGDVDMFLS